MSLREIKENYGAFGFYCVVILLLLGSTFLGFKFGHYLTESQVKKMATMAQSIENLKSENNELTKKLNILGVELEVQQLANMQAQQSITEGMEREFELREQLGFYQKVMAPELQQDGFVIDAFNVESTLSDHVYRFDLVLMQQSRTKSVVKGNIDIMLEGSQNGKPKEIRLLDLMTEERAPLTFSFKYFEVLRGQFSLPEDFLAEQIVVSAEVFKFKKKRGDLERTFDWQAGPPPNSALESE